MIKLVLSSLLIYQASFLLAPKSISGHIKKLMRDFLWHSGKGNQRKMHLVKWDIAKRSLHEGGLQIRDSEHANTSMGCKLLWQMHRDPEHPASHTLRHKYVPAAALRNLQETNSRKSTQLWSLCKKGIPFFYQHLYQIPGNNRRVKIWLDKIMGHAPLEPNAILGEICELMKSRGIKTLYDIFEWEDVGNWIA